LKTLEDDYKNYPRFIETGTYHGDTILALEPYFSKLHTIEFSPKHYNFGNNKYNGDNSIVFETLLQHIDDNTIFFLDGHWSSGNTGNRNNFVI
jgi:hypothetical protein